MLPVGRKLVVHVVEELTRVGITRMLFVTGPGRRPSETISIATPSLI
jgi:UTP-glucose-1-phosphate uridylyltransferase